MASGDIFLKLTNIKGEAKDSAHTDEIDIESFSFGMSNASGFGSGGGGGAGKVSFQDITVQKFADAATGPLMQACANGTHIDDGVITVRKAGGTQEEFYKISLKHILVTSVSNTGVTGGNPSESVSLSFSLVNLDYKEQADDGSLKGVVHFGWDVKLNKKV